MLNLSKITVNDISRDILERLYSEAYNYISEERKRMGEKELKSVLLENLNDCSIIKYDIDSYVVGICSYHEHQYNGKKYLLHRHPIYGTDKNGSRAWWYSEEFQKNNAEFVRNEGLNGVITLFNPNSPAAKAVKNHFGSFGKYYNRPIIFEDPSELLISLDSKSKDILKAFLIELNSSD